MPWLTFQQRIEVKIRLELGQKILNIADQYGVHRSTIHKIKRRICLTGSVHDQRRPGDQERSLRETSEKL